RSTTTWASITSGPPSPTSPDGPSPSCGTAGRSPSCFPPPEPSSRGGGPMIAAFSRVGVRCLLAVCLLPLSIRAARAELPSPVLHTVFPAGGQAGTAVTVAVDGAALDGLRDIRSTVPRLAVQKTGTNRFTLAIPAETPPGVYDLRAVGL